MFRNGFRRDDGTITKDGGWEADSSIDSVTDMLISAYIHSICRNIETIVYSNTMSNAL